MVSVIQPYPQSKVKSSSSFVENEEKKLKRCNGTSPRGTKVASDIWTVWQRQGWALHLSIWPAYQSPWKP